jgi:hypothetical protein
MAALKIIPIMETNTGVEMVVSARAAARAGIL